MKKGKILSILVLAAALFMCSKSVNAESVSYNRVPGVTDYNNASFQYDWNGINGYSKIYGLSFGRGYQYNYRNYNKNLGSVGSLPFPFDRRLSPNSEVIFSLGFTNGGYSRGDAIAYTAGYCVGWGVPFAEFSSSNTNKMAGQIIDYHNAKRTRNGDMINDDQFEQLKYVMTYAYRYPVVRPSEIPRNLPESYGVNLWAELHYYGMDMVNHEKACATQYLAWITVNGYLNDDYNRTKIENYLLELDTSHGYPVNHNVTKYGVDREYYAYRDLIRSAMKMPSYSTKDTTAAMQYPIELKWSDTNQRFEAVVPDSNRMSTVERVNLSYSNSAFQYTQNGDGSVTIWTTTPTGTKENPVLCDVRKDISDAQQGSIFSQGPDNQPIIMTGPGVITETSYFSAYTQAINIRVYKELNPITGNFGDASPVGCKYGIYPTADCTPDSMIQELTIGDNGKTELSKYLPYQVYYVKETQNNESTSLNTTVYTVDPDTANLENGALVCEVSSNNDIVFGGVDVVKYRDDPNTTVDAAADLAKLRLVLKNATREQLNGGREVYEGIVDKEGRLQFRNIPYGTYILCEIDTATNRYIEIDEVDIHITKQDEIPYKICSDDKFSVFVKIFKQDKRNGEIVKLPGAEFKIWNTETHVFESFEVYPSGNITDTLVTDAEGKAMTPEVLYSGEYRIYEIKAPEGYYLNEELRLPEKETFAELDTHGMALSIHKDNDTKEEDLGNGIILETYEIDCKDDEKTINLEIFKDGEVFTSLTQETTVYGELYKPNFTKKGLVGATFEIYAEENIMSADGRVVKYAKGTKMGTVTTNEEGKGTFTDLLPGTYKLVETVTPVGYVKADDEIITLERKDHDQLVPYEIQNKEKTNVKQKLYVKAHKLFSVSEYKLNVERKAIFGVFASQDIYNYDRSVVIPKDGIVELIEFKDNEQVSEDVDLPVGTYYVQEIFTTSPYELTGEKKTVELVPGNNTSKEVEMDAGTFINNPVTKDIKLIKFSATSILEANNVGITGIEADEDEVEEALGEFLQTIRTEGMDSVMDVIEDKAYITLEGAEYSLFWDEECQIPVCYETSGEPVVVTTKPDSCFYEIDDLPVGVYYIKETKAPVYTDGEFVVPYKVNEKIVQLEVLEENGNQNNIIVRPLWDEMVDGINIEKTEIFTGDTVENCVFEISDKDHNVKLHSTTNDKGEALIPVDILKNGETYYYTEISAPEKYELDTTPHPFVAKYDAHFDEDGKFYFEWQGDELKVTNVIKSRKLIIRKVDEETGDPLAGCIFSIALLDEEGNIYVNEEGEEVYLVKDGVTDENGEYVVDEAYFGTYKFTEIKAPEGYELTDDDMLGYVFTISKNSPETVIFEVTNTGDIAVYAISALALASVLGIAYVATKKVKAHKA